VTNQMLQADYLALISQVKIAVFLPHLEEGFYLPPLEAMFMETLVICPGLHWQSLFLLTGV